MRGALPPKKPRGEGLPTGRQRELLLVLVACLSRVISRGKHCTTPFTLRSASTIVQSAHSLYIEILSQGCGGAGVVARVVARRAAREAATVSVAREVATEAAVTEAAATERRRGEGGGE